MNTEGHINSTNKIDDVGKSDYVVLLHGIVRSSKHMRQLENFLSQHGFDVINLDYPSTTMALHELIEETWPKISDRLIENKPVHMVGYSMGGLLIRAILSKYCPQNLGRVVLLAPPNKGSEVADFLKRNWLYRKIYGPAGQQLTTNQRDIAHLFKKIDYQCGVIAGSFSMDPLSSLLIKGKDDGKVSIESTKVEGMIDHTVVSATHTFFPQNKDVHRQTLHFIQHGKFKI